MGGYSSSKMPISAGFFAFTLVAVVVSEMKAASGNAAAPSCSSELCNRFLNPHNTARYNVNKRVSGGRGPLGELKWDATVAAYAEEYARNMSRPGVDCSKLVHSGSDIYGENLAWCSGEMSPEEAVKMWVDEETYYNYDRNSCSNGQMCGHYTQVVWKATKSVGCAMARCNQNKENTFITCNYYPPGNYFGERPY